MAYQQFAAGKPTNESVTYEILIRKMNPIIQEVKKPVFRAGVVQAPGYPQHYGWNPVYWSDYPKQPAWTVPMPKIAAPIVQMRLPDLPRLPCHIPPTEHMTLRTCPTWVPDIPARLPHEWNPYVDQSNIPFRDLLGPPYLQQK